MSTQTALVLTEIGKPLTKITLPVPDASELQENQILIKITAAGLAPFDRKLRDLNFFNIGAHLPAIISSDVVGIVVKSGPGASFPIGTHIFSQVLFDFPTGGALQEYTIINGLYAAAVPAGISDVEAALYPINAVTSAMTLFSANGFGMPFPGTPEAANFDYASQKVAIIGGGTNVGKLTVQLASLAGIGTIIAISSLSGAALLKSFGATHVIDRQDSNIEEQVRSIIGDELLYAYDTFGNPDLAVSLLSNSKRGTFVYITTNRKLSEEVLAKKKGGVEVKFAQGISSAIPEFGKLFWKQFPVWLENGKIKPSKYNVIEGLDAVKVNKVLDEYRDGKGGDRYHVRVA